MYQKCIGPFYIYKLRQFRTSKYFVFETKNEGPMEVLNTEIDV